MKFCRTIFFVLTLLFIHLLPQYHIQAQTTVRGSYCSGQRFTDQVSIGGFSFTIDTVFYNVNEDSPQIFTISIPGADYLYTVYPSFSTTDTVDVCDNYSWHVGTLTRHYTASDTDTVVLVSSNGCDSIRRLALTVRYSSSTTLDETACDFFVWHDSTYHLSTTVVFDTLNRVGCDSTTTLNLSVHYGTYNAYTDSACRTYRWRSSAATGYDTTLTYPLDGSWIHTLQHYTNAVGCPSVDTLHLRMHDRDTLVQSPQTACDSFLWYGNYVTVSGVYEHFVPNAVGGVCDSVIILQLDIYPSYTDTTAVPVEDFGFRCGSFNWHGSTFLPDADSVSAFYTVQSVHNCDSLVAMRVLVNTLGDSIMAEIEDCGSYSYQPVGDPNPVIFTSDTLYTVRTMPGAAANGCDSLWRIRVTIYPTYNDTMSLVVCGTYQWVNVTNPSFDADNNPVYDSVYRISDTLGPVTYNTHPQVSEHCDSIVTLALVVLPNDTVVDTLSSCFPITYGDSTYGVSTLVYDTLPGMAANGCPIIGEHHIVIFPTVESHDTVDACYQYVWLSHLHTVTTDTTGLFATQHGCDSTVRLHIVIHDSVSSDETAVICGDTTWNGLYFPQMAAMSVVYDTTAHLADIWGCDSTAHITLTVKPVGIGHWYDTVCDQYEWYGSQYTGDTTVSYRSQGLAASGCDTITYLHLTIHHSTVGRIDTTVCDTFEFYTTVPARGSNAYYHGRFTQSDSSYHVTLTNVAGCDSIVSLCLRVNHTNTGDETLEGCDSLFWNGVWYYVSGDHQQTLTNGEGCDSVASLHLTIHNSTVVPDMVVACDSYTWPMNGITYMHSSTTYPSVTLTDAFGCDSTVKLHLTMHYSDLNAVDVVSACDSLEWNGAVYYSNTTTPTFNTHTAFGCDSTVTLNLNIRHSVSAAVDTLVCDSVRWHTGVWYHASTVFNDTLTGQSANGCDSINIVQLTVAHPLYTHLYDAACESYTWSQTGQTYTMTEDVVDTVVSSLGCDSIIILHLTIYHGDTVQSIYNTNICFACDSFYWNGQTYTQTGVYQMDFADAHGCTQRQWLDLTVGTVGNDTIYRVGCDSVTYDSLRYFYSDTLYVYDSTITSTCNIYHWVYLKVNHPVGTTQTVVTCDRYEWTDGVSYRYEFTRDTVASIILPRNVGACDSTVTLNLTVHHPTVNNDVVSACDSYYGTPLQRTYTQSFDSVINLTSLNGTVNRYGCDSLLRQVVTIRHSSTARVDTMVCQGLAWNGVYYTADIYGPLLAYQNNEGCRHLDTLNLTVYHPDTAIAETRIMCDSTRWFGNLYTTSGTYYHHVDSVSNGVCDSVYVLQLTVYHTEHDTLTDGNCYVYTWNRNHQSYTASGLYGITRNGVAAGGCDSVYLLDLSIYQNVTEDIYDTVCDAIVWNGTSYNISGTYNYYTQSSHGCDSVALLHLTVHHADTVSAHEYTTVCGNYVWKGSNYTMSGLYRYDTLTVNGCDSTVWLHLTVNSYDTIDTLVVNGLDASYCDSYTWNIDGRSHHYTASGVYFDTVVPNVALCGQLHRLDLNIPQSTGDTVVSPHCGNWTYGGVTYYADTLIERGRDRGGNSVGCDLIHYLKLIINHPVIVVDTQNVCDSLLWIDGNTYTADNHTATYLVPGGSTLTHCDSTVALQLTVRHSSILQDTLTGCDSRYWHLVGRTYYADFDTVANYTTLTGTQNAAGCDSLIAMHLSVPLSSSTIDSVVHCGPYRWANGVLYTASVNGPTYFDINRAGCDSTVTLHLEIYQSANSYEVDTVCDSITWHGTTYTATGFYADPHVGVIHGVCDSVYYYDLVVYNTHYAPVDQVSTRLFYQWPRTGQWYRASGLYTQTINNVVNGFCDSVYTLRLNVYGDSVRNDIQVACGQYMWRGRTYYATGIYRDTVRRAVHGVADSIYILDLTLYNPDTLIQNVVACNEYIWMPDTLTATNTYYHYDRNAIGGVCDRVHKLNLTIQQIYSDSTSVTVCGGFNWRGHHYMQSGDYCDVVQRTAVNACDSIFKIHLIVNREYNVVDNRTACDAFYWAPSNRTFIADTTMVENLYTSLGCDSIVTLNLHIERSSSRVSHRYHEACGIYTWPLTGHTYTASATDTYVFSDGHTCDSTITLHLTVYPVNTTVINSSGCDSYRWHGTTYTSSGSYYDTVLTSHGCDSIINMQLTIYHSDRSGVETDTACDSYTWHGQTYTASTQTATFDTLTTHGCDSTVTLYLTVYNSRNVMSIRDRCDSYTWHGRTFTESTDTATYHTLTSNGCDSTVTLHLTIRHSTTGILDTAACSSMTWLDGQTYTSSTTTPTYTYVGTNSVGCDSTVTMHLTIYPVDTTVTRRSGCDSYRWHGTTYTASGSYFDTVQTSHGCDSIINMQLTIYHSDRSGVETDTACDSYTWHGQTYTASTQTATFDTLTTHGCDSTVTLYLTVYSNYNIESTRECCDYYMWHGVTYTESTDTATYHTFSSHGCDSTVTLHLTIKHSTTGVLDTAVCSSLTWIDGHTYSVPTTTPTYTYVGGNAAGCDSTVTLHLTLRDNSSVVDVNACDSLEWNGHVYHSSETLSEHLTNVAGCDSLVTYRLNVYHVASTVEALTACDSLQWHGTTYTYSVSDAVWHEQTAMGCDSTVTLHLTLNHSSVAVVNRTACDSYRWHGTTYSENTEIGEAAYVTTNAEGCDSTTWLVLTLHHSTATAFNDSGVDVYTWNGIDYTETGTYSQTLTTVDGCDSVVTLHLVMIDFPVPQILVHNDRLLMVDHHPDGATEIDYIAYRWYRNNTLIPSATHDYYNLPNYQILSGCYYVEVPVDESRALWVPSNTICIGLGIDEVDEDFSVTFYPNPVVSGAQLVVRTSVPKSTLSLYDLHGRQLMQQRSEGELTTFTADFPAGVYTLQVETLTGSKVTKKLIVR